MATSSTKSKSYDKARKSFDDLEMDQRAKFLFEATASTFAEGIEKVSSALSSELESIFESCQEQDADVEGTAKKKTTARKKAAKKTARKSSKGKSESE